MKVFVLVLRLSFGLFLLAVGWVMLGVLAGRTLPYMGEIAYISTPSGVNQLYLMDVQRQFKVHLKPDFVNDCCLTWSPDGGTLTFIRDMSSDGSTDIFSMNFHTPVQRLTSAAGADLYPAYSPDGAQIAYTSYGYNNPQISLMNRDGSQPHALSGPKLIVNLNPHPVWSVDGKSVLFSDFGNLDSLLAVRSDCVDRCEDAIQNAFDMNGLPLMTTSFIALDSSRLFLAAFEATKQGGYGIYSFDTNMKNAPERLTINAGLASPAMAAYDHWIAFASGVTDVQEPIEDANLYILDSDCIGSQKGCAGSLQKIATRLRAEDNLSWSADGHWLAYVTVIERLSQLNLLDTTCIREHLDCADYIHPLPVTSTRYIRPVWRPQVQ